ncbi:hypothetical protein V5738_08500 [Salinisphaera sp. SPP-AMP-43]|uniref:hypothetical protein n=1 Tax=Salinisphaera sp. SPP-AMP-43 TaxID=3121288 RepID=UPI003C6DC112
MLLTTLDRYPDWLTATILIRCAGLGYCESLKKINPEAVSISAIFERRSADPAGLALAARILPGYEASKEPSGSGDMGYA